MILRTIGRMLWVAIAFLFAVLSAVVMLLALGGAWLGQGLRATAPAEPLPDAAIDMFGVVLFAGAVAPALTALPALLAVIVGEVLRIRSWLYYVPAGGAALAVVPLMAAPVGGAADLPSAEYVTLFAAAGFAGGFVYWLLAGQRA